MKPKIAVVRNDSFSESIHHVGGIDDLNNSERNLVVKVGIFDPRTGICTTPSTITQIANLFSKSPNIYIVESNSAAGIGMDRLKVWEECYNERVIPFNLSDDPDTSDVTVAGEDVPFSSLLFSGSTFISTHVPRRYEKAGLEDLMNLGFNIKNLLGLILDTKKNRFHDDLPNALNDMYEIIGGIDLAVLDGTQTYLGFEKKRIAINTETLIVGRDAFAVESAGMYMVGMDPEENPVLKEAKDRGLGETDLDKIEVIGDLEKPRSSCLEAFEKLKRP